MCYKLVLQTAQDWVHPQTLLVSIVVRSIFYSPGCEVVVNCIIVSCGIPDFPSANISKQEDIPIFTHEGSQIRFLCDDGEESVLKCSRNNTWIPNPSEIKCSNIMILR